MNLPILTDASSDFPVIQYADGALLILQACPAQLTVLKDLLSTFAQSTGLRVNYNKSVLVPLNISEEKLVQLSDLIGCQTGNLPFTYLGLPLGTTKPNIEDFLPLIQRIERRLTCTSSFLSQGGKLEMVNTVFSSSAVFHISSIKLHKGVIKQLDKYRKHCLWRSSDLQSKKPSKTSWSLVCLPKKEGLGSNRSLCAQQCSTSQVLAQVLHESGPSLGKANLELLLQ